MENLSIGLHGTEAFDVLRARNQGFLLASAHFGSFEALRVLGISERSLPVKTLMYMENAEQLNDLLADVNPEVTESVIPLGQPGAMLEVREWLGQGGIIGVLADRITQGDKMTEVDFLGAPAEFPLGPWLLSRMLGVPVVLCLAVYRGSGHYDIYFEPLPEPEETMDRQEAAKRLAAAYAGRLEHYCRKYPYNWFNFFDFWSDEKKGGD
jgi:predicted LPLAT superfamily acyltransferase